MVHSRHIVCRLISLLTHYLVYTDITEGRICQYPFGRPTPASGAGRVPACVAVDGQGDGIEVGVVSTEFGSGVHEVVG